MHRQLDASRLKKRLLDEASSLRQVQPIADRVAQNLEIISKKNYFSTRRTRILMGFIISIRY